MVSWEVMPFFWVTINESTAWTLRHCAEGGAVFTGVLTACGCQLCQHTSPKWVNRSQLGATSAVTLVKNCILPSISSWYLTFPDSFAVIFNVTIPFNPSAPWVHWDAPFLGRSLCMASILLVSYINCILGNNSQVTLFLWAELSKLFHRTCVLWHFSAKSKV